MKGLMTLGIVMAILFAACAVEMLFDRYRPKTSALVRALLVLAAAFAIGIGAVRLAHGRDLGQWETSDPTVREWYRGLMQPDNPQLSCCGEADAYWCDDYYSRGGQAYCRVTDDRLDAPLRRPHVDIGTEIEIPPHKLKWDRANPTGHGVVFMSRAGYVYCFVAPGGV